ncbi:BTAD domain-containing putative transcriptional regulator [Streptomyces sp. RFCAC02]|uniref:AfsR/SARP family transcriptional regulator n=1 Tax=Streptomyces sp. RFCAC02 TaxID=2499143 RepID=UPI0010213A1C|nr:BTAD domain-containing putative transcriptional regulator [Streptomyces sp. RFCAC02]
MTEHGVRFEVLGPLRALRAGVEIPLGPPRQRSVLAALLLRAPRPVSAERIIAMVWGAEGPSPSVNLIQKYVSGLRRCLPVTAPITLTTAGYAIDPRGGFDLWEFEELLASARAARGGGEPARAREALSRATALWRGPLAEDTVGPGIELERDRLAEQQLITLEEFHALGLDLGRGSEQVPELVRLAAEHPQREHLHGLLMRALTRSGRQIEALDVYTRIRQRLAEEYGTDPGPELRAAHQYVLTGGTTGGAGPRRPAVTEAPTAVPAQLPHEAYGFTGRAQQVARITGLLRSGGMPIVYVEGTAGVGKTALAVHCAHRVIDDFPDGQLFADLRGFDPLGPAHPTEILGGFLRSLGVPNQHVPPDTRERSSLFRSLLAKRRVLVLLDNAAHTEQIRPLLPGSPGCAVLITSQRRLTGLVAGDGARHVDLPVLPADEAEELLHTMLGPAAGRSAGEIARLCGYLPLALRLVAAGAAVTSDDLDGIARRLVTEDPLAHAAVPGDEQLSVSASLDLSYHSLDETSRRVLRRLGIVPLNKLTRRAAAALAGLDEEETGRALDALVAANLVESYAPRRYRFPHDLLREYARRRAHTDEVPAEREAAVHRLTAWSLRAAAVVAGGPTRLHVVGPGAVITSGPDRDSAEGRSLVKEANGELSNLPGLAVHTAEHGPLPAAWMLAARLWGMCKHNSLMPEWLTGALAGLRAARRAGDRRAEGELSVCLIDAMLIGGKVEQAQSYAHHALAVGQDPTLPDVRAAAYEYLGRLRWLAGDLTEARDLLTQAVRLFTAEERPQELAVALCGLGRVEVDLGRPHLARRRYRTALRLARALGVVQLQAMALTELGVAEADLNRLDQAQCAQEAALAASGGFPRTAALAQAFLGVLHAAHGRYDLARSAAAEALRIAETHSDRWALAESHNAVGRAMALIGDRATAAGHHRSALSIARGLGYRRGELHALTGLVASLPDAAERTLIERQAGSMARRHGYAALVRRLAQAHAQPAAADVRVRVMTGPFARTA